MAFFAQCIESANQMAKQFAPLMIKLQETIEKYNQPIPPEAEAWAAKVVIEFKKQFENCYGPINEQLLRRFEDLPASIKDSILMLGNHGWFFDFEMSLPGLWNLQKALSEGNVEGVENALIEYFSERLDKIENLIIGRYPHREKIIRSAFGAHKREEYELSVPVLLAQADGICCEVTKCNFFRSKNKKPRTAIYVEQIASDTYQSAILQPLAQQLPINLSEDKRDKDFNELNRHMVLHGESLDYGTKVNSLKAISLINYVAQLSA